MEELTLPELGENIEEAGVSAVLVSVGDVVRRDQPVVEVETEKASLEVPATRDGKVAELLVKQGDKVRVGQLLMRLEERLDDSTQDEQADDGDAPAPATPAPVATGAAEKPDADSDAATAAASAPDATPAPMSDDDATPVIAFPARGRPKIGDVAPAAPSARALANQLGVDINEVEGSGPGGRISRNDVKAHAKRILRERGPAAGPGAVPAPPLPDFAQWGAVEREPLSGIRRATAAAMGNAWNTIPHVTQFDHADITQVEAMRRRFNRRPEAAERKLSITALAIKIVAGALAKFPKFNASLDLAGDSVIFKKYVHVGVAVDTERGLLVPVIRDVDRKSVLQIAVELNELAERARSKKITPDEMRGACFTVSNLGGLGTTYFSPIVNWPEVAILGVGRAEKQAAHVDGKFHPALVLPMSLSYDHRLIDGADAARFLRWVAEGLEQPLLLLLDE